jgi:GH25 family lysozyme M1 (1,4-beta-N-acetylmuramidase)
MIYGQDWASYQGDTPATSGIDFVFIKVTQGLTYENPYWRDQLAAADAAGLVTGLYHYPDMRNGAVEELQHFLMVIGTERNGRMLMLDWEGYDKDNQTVSHADQAAYKDAWLEAIRTMSPWTRSVLYANLDYWRNVDTSGRFGDALFIATANLPAGQPGIATPWLFHQYGTNRGVDADVANFPSRAALAAWVNRQETNMPVLDQADLNAIRAEMHAELNDPKNRALFVSDNLWWWAHALQGTVPAGASPAAEASIRAIHAAYVVLQNEPQPAPAVPATA